MTSAPGHLRRRELLLAASALTLLIAGCLLCFCPTEGSDAEIAENTPALSGLGDHIVTYKMSDTYQFQRAFEIRLTLLTQSDPDVSKAVPEGCYLAKWQDEYGNQYDKRQTFNPYRDITLTPVWEKNSYGVRVMPGSEPYLTVMNGDKVLEGWVPYGTELTVKAVAREGYTPNIQVSTNNYNYSPVVDGKFTVIWTMYLKVDYVQAEKPDPSEKLTVDYNVDGGSPQIASASVPKGDYTISDTVPVKDGYIFIGWHDGTKTLKSGDKIVLSESITLTAVWSAVKPVAPSGDTGPVVPGKNL